MKNEGEKKVPKEAIAVWLCKANTRWGGTLVVNDGKAIIEVLKDIEVMQKLCELDYLGECEELGDECPVNKLKRLLTQFPADSQ